MALQPKRVKFRKQQRGNRAGFSKGGTNLVSGEFGLQALTRGWLKAEQLEAARVAITRHMKRRGKVWITVFPDKPITGKPAEVRMGKGKGAPVGWVAVIRPGRIMFELEGVPETLAREALRLAADKFSIRTRFVTRHAI
jgi:large subunit ribosomal protein L16